MTLTFRSSIPESRIFIERDPDGRQRVARATRESGNRQWALAVEHPAGQVFRGSFNGQPGEVVLAPGQMLSRTENEYVQAKARGDKPPEKSRDLNVRVDEFGGDVSAPVRGYLKR